MLLRWCIFRFIYIYIYTIIYLYIYEKTRARKQKTGNTSTTSSVLSFRPKNLEGTDAETPTPVPQLIQVLQVKVDLASGHVVWQKKCTSEMKPCLKNVKPILKE